MVREYPSFGPLIWFIQCRTPFNSAYYTDREIHFVVLTRPYQPLDFFFWLRGGSGGISVQEGGGGGGQSFANFRQISFDFAYFLTNIDKHGNDKNDFLQAQRIRQLDK